MNFEKKQRITFFISLLTIVLMGFIFIPLQKVYAVQSKVNLGTADRFAVLGGSTITNTGSSVIVGDIGLSPGSAITGFPPGVLNGSQYVANPVAVQAKTDLITAYDDASGRTPVTTVPTELGGTTLKEGVYDSVSGTFGITGTLTLDAQGDSSAVFIFKTSSLLDPQGTTLITAGSSRVVLTNGAQACNVFWQVGSSATLGTNSIFIGNILALTSITLTTNASVTGRVLARNGAVTLDSNAITVSTCTAAISSTTNSSSGTAIPYCIPISNQIVTPIIIESKRIDKDSIFIKWGPYSGTDTFNVVYGFEKGNLIYNVDVTGFSTTINALHSNQPIWVQVAARNNCQIGTYGEVKLVGGPKLPSTGFAPQNDNPFIDLISQIKNWFLLGH